MDQAEQLRNVIKLQNQRNIPRMEPQAPPRARVITVTSGKGGVGKSNVAVNIAVQLRRLGKKVLIFDADLGLANVEVMFGAVPQYNLSDLIYRGKNIREIISKGPMDIGFISGGSGIVSLNNLSNDQLAFLIHNLSDLDQLADFIIIDTGAGISDHVLEFVIKSPEVLVITTQEPSSLTDSYSLLKALHRNPNFRKKEVCVRVIANKVHSEEHGRIIFDKLNSVVSKFLDGELEYLGMVPEDAQLDKAVLQQSPVSIYKPNARSTKAFELLTKRLLDKEMLPQETQKRGITQLVTGLVHRNG
ncbi:MAG: MinD/ParA family protein [Lachnospiraceae bacterium]